jgi:serine-type D-Ala-D-Ala carboxypeptidase/endopeptidase (penicillin-binding protein 4)
VPGEDQEGQQVRRRSQVVVACTVLTVAATGGAVYVGTHADVDVQREPEPVVTAAPRAEPLATLTDAAAPTAAGVAAALDRLVGAPGLGGGLAGVIADATTGEVLFSQRADDPLTPASTVKLLTAVAALHALGPDARLTTEVVRDGDTLYLVGGGDMTLASRQPRTPTYPPAPTLRDLATKVATTVGADRGTEYRLRYDATAWSGPTSAPGWNDGYFLGGDVSRLSALAVDEGRVVPGEPARVADPAGYAAEKLATALDDAGVDTRGKPRPGVSPPAATPVATVSSAPVAALVQRMLTFSDNDLAEALGRAVALATGGTPTFGDAARAVRQQLVDLGVPVGGIHLSDASGLSRLDTVTAASLVAVLRLVQERPELRPVVAGLPVAGFSGTVFDRFRERDTRRGAGVVRAKTGTLNGVSALAGQLVDADGRLLVFAFLTDRAPSPDVAEDALDALAARLARCGCDRAA